MLRTMMLSAPEIFDLFLGFVADSFANGQQPNHAGDADKNTEHGKRRSHRMQQ